MSVGHRIMCGHVCLTVAVDRGTKPAALGVVVSTRGCERKGCTVRSKDHMGVLRVSPRVVRDTSFLLTSPVSPRRAEASRSCPWGATSLQYGSSFDTA